MCSAAATDRCTNAVRGPQLGVNKEGRAAAHTRGPISRAQLSHQVFEVVAATREPK
jgi:hypothetical protein